MLLKELLMLKHEVRLLHKHALTSSYKSPASLRECVLLIGTTKGLRLLHWECTSRWRDRVGQKSCARVVDSGLGRAEIMNFEGVMEGVNPRDR